jgi:hypothetical protein
MKILTHFGIFIRIIILIIGGKKAHTQKKERPRRITTAQIAIIY